MTTALLESAEGETKYVARPGIESGTSGSCFGRATNCAMRPSWSDVVIGPVSAHSGKFSTHMVTMKTDKNWSDQ